MLKLTGQQNPDNPNVQDVTPEIVLANKEQLCLIDVRRPDEYTGELGHIPGAKLIVLDTLPDHLSELPTDQTVVFICRSGARSGRASAFAFESGLKNTYNMLGGMLLWNEKQLPTEHEDSE